MNTDPPSMDEIRQLGKELGDRIVRTPTVECPWGDEIFGQATQVRGKLEFLQRTGTFKARGALANLLSLTHSQREAGVTAVSAGNHAIAVAYAASVVGTTAKVVMLEHSNPARVAACEALGAEVIRVADVHLAFQRVREIEADEGRAFIHPFEGHGVLLGTGMVGLEMIEQWPDMDMLIVPVGGGGLIAGISNAVKQLKPDCEIIGVEPTGADTMSRSFASGQPESLDAVKTIADSLGAPFALPMSFAAARDNVDRLVTIEDDEIAAAMGFLFRKMKVAVEPACAAATAALLGPLKSSASGRKIMLTFCGSNIDWQTWQSLAVFDA